MAENEVGDGIASSATLERLVLIENLLRVSSGFVSILDDRCENWSLEGSPKFDSAEPCRASGTGDTTAASTSKIASDVVNRKPCSENCMDRVAQNSSAADSRIVILGGGGE